MTREVLRASHVHIHAPMPPCRHAAMAAAAFFSSTCSATATSVVRMRPATDDAFCSACGSPWFRIEHAISTRSPYSSVCVEAEVALAFDDPVHHDDGSAPAFATCPDALERAADDLMPRPAQGCRPSPCRALARAMSARRRRDDALFTAARVACSASSTRPSSPSSRLRPRRP